MTNIVYLITNLVNGKRYIGVTKRDLGIRWRQHCSRAYAGAGQVISFAIRKYGEDMFRICPLVVCVSYADALSEERRLIGLLLPEYNMTAGGEGVLGLVITAETRRKMSAAKAGKPSAKRDKTVSSATRNKISASLKRRYEGGLVSAITENRYVRDAPVVCLNDGLMFSSGCQADKHYGFAKLGSATRVARGQRKQHRGYRFSFTGNLQ